MYVSFALFPSLLENLQGIAQKLHLKLRLGDADLINEDGVCGMHD